MSWPSFSSSRMPALLWSTPGGEVVAGDFLERKEAVAFGAVVDEAGFQRRLYAGDATLVDVGLLLFLGRDLDVEIVKVLAFYDGHPQLFTLSRVDQHAFHCRFSLSRRSTAVARCAGKALRADGGRSACRVSASASARQPYWGCCVPGRSCRRSDGEQWPTRTVTMGFRSCASLRRSNRRRQPGGRYGRVRS